MDLIQAIEELARLPLKALQSELAQNSRHNPCKPSEISEDHILSPDVSHKILYHRVYLPHDSKRPYTDVGWVLTEDVTFCMLCRTQLSDRHHCHACGNIMCGECNIEMAVIAELIKAGELHVCSMCYYGQEIVYAIPNRPIKTTQHGQPPLETREQMLKRQKSERQQEFRHEALARVASSSLLKANPPTTLNDNANTEIDHTSSFGREEQRDIISTPTPGYVLKVKRLQTNEKIFINICTHPLIPINTQNSNGDIYMIANQPLVLKSAKIFDVVINSTILETAKADLTIINEINNQVIALIQRSFDEQFETQPVILRLQFNYKGEPNPAAGTDTKAPPVMIRKLVIPSEAAFLEHKQIGIKDSDHHKHYVVDLKAAEISPKKGSAAITSSSSSGGKSPLSPSTTTTTAAVLTPPRRPHSHSGPSFLFKSFASSRSVSSVNDADIDAATSVDMSESSHEAILHSKQALPTPPASELRNKTITQSCDLALQYMQDSREYGLDTVFKALLLTHSDLASLQSSKSYSAWLDHVRKDEVNLREAILFPEAGYVIEAHRQANSNIDQNAQNQKQKVLVNVCHHPAVGCLVETNNAETVTAIPKPCPFVLNRVSLIDNISSDCMLVIDVVIPSSILLLAVHDDTGDLRDLLSSELLQQLAGCTFSSFNNDDFILPFIAGGYYPHNTNAMLNIAPCLNLTEQQKMSCTIAILGQVWIKGHVFGLWKEKYVVDIDKHFLFFKQPRMQLEGCISLDCNAMVKPIAHDECTAPAGSYCLSILPAIGNSNDGSSEKWECYWRIQTHREIMRIIVRARAHHMQAMHILTNTAGVNLNTIDEDQEEAQDDDEDCGLGQEIAAALFDGKI